MPQLVGQRCAICRQGINWIGDSRFCSDCGRAIHNVCATTALTEPAPGSCPECGSRPKHDRVPVGPEETALWLVLASGSSRAKWLLRWDDASFALEDPEGRTVLKLETRRAHRTVDFFRLHADCTIRLFTPDGPLVFRRNTEAFVALRKFVAAGLASDAEYLASLEGQALWKAGLGTAMFVGAAFLFGLYCWYAAQGQDPPPGHWIRDFGQLIRITLWLLLAAVAGGGYWVYLGLHQWRLLGRVVPAQARVGAAPSALPDGSKENPYEL